MRRSIVTIAIAALAGISGAAALAPSGSMPDITRMHRERVNCHNAFDALVAARKAGGAAATAPAELAFAEAYEKAAAAKQPCPAVPASVIARATNRTVSNPESVGTLTKYIGNGDPSAHFEAGMTAFEQKLPNVPQADSIAFFKKAAELGDPDAMFMMARLYLGGQFGTKLDWKGAYPYFEGAAKAGHVDAIFFLGQYAYDGALGKKDPKAAFDYYSQAAARGHVYATYMAAWQANSGDGVRKDHALAYRLARNLVDQGEVAGAVIAASALLQVKNARANENEVLYWMDVAMRDGDDRIKGEIGKFRPQVVAAYQRMNAPPEYRPRVRKVCPMKTVCLVNRFTNVQSCTTNKDYWNDCDL